MKKKNLGGWAFLPIIVFLVLYVGFGLFFTFNGTEGAFSFFPRHVALLAGVAVAFMLAPSISIKEKVDTLSEGMGNSGVMMIVLIYLMAGGFQGAAAASGGKDSVVNLCLNFIPVTFLVPGVFVMCSLISTAIGTSMGTIAAMAPVAISVAEGAGLNTAIIGAAVIGGSYFGDNLSMISDTTISAAEGCGSEMKDKFYMNFKIALPAAIVTVILYSIFGGHGSGEIAVGSYNILLVIPYIAVLVAAISGINVAIVLFIGILLTGVLGFITKSVGFFDWIRGIGSGMSDMFSISIVAILISGIISLVRLYGGVDYVVEKISSRVDNRRKAEYGIGLLSGILSAAMVNNTIAIIVTAPIAKEIGGRYHIAPKRLASLIDIFACAFLAVVPHDGGMLIVTELGSSSPIEVMKYSFYIYAVIIATIITIQFGLLRTPEEKEFLN